MMNPGSPRQGTLEFVEERGKLRPAFALNALGSRGVRQVSSAIQDGDGFEPVHVSVVIASIDARATIRSSVAAFLREIGDHGELILVDASRDGSANDLERTFPKIRVIRQPAGSLAPELWSEGILAARFPLVALSTAQMVPLPGWLDAHRSCIHATGAAGVGGPIEPSPSLSVRDRAIYLLRYVNYGLPLSASEAFEPPGDNALYLRASLNLVQESWRGGFWEVEVHRRLRAGERRLDVTGGARLEFHGGTPFLGLIRQRWLHARHYGAARSAWMGQGRRLAQVLAAPIVPAVLLVRIARALRKRGRPFFSWLAALPTLCLLLIVWTVGELMGTLFGPPPIGTKRGWVKA